MTTPQPYFDLLKRCLTASLYEESSWILLQGPMKNETGLVPAAQRLIIGCLRRLGLRLVRTSGANPSLRERGRDWPLFGMTMVGTRRLDNVHACVERVLRDNVPGDFVETGVWRGGTCILAKAIFNQSDPRRTVWCCDSFEGMPAPSEKDRSISRFADFSDREYLAVSEEQVKRNFEKFGLLDDKVRFVKGWFCHTLPDVPIKQIAVLRMDGDLYESTMDAINNLYSKVSEGGFVIVDDYLTWPGCKKAIDEFRAANNISDPPIKIDDDAIFWRKGTNSSSVDETVAIAETHSGPLGYGGK